MTDEIYMIYLQSTFKIICLFEIFTLNKIFVKLNDAN